jgi:hypothetical protein
MDFLSHYGLLVDPRNKRLIDRTTKLSTRGYTVDSKVDSVSIKTIIGETNYHRLLAEFPDLTRPSVFGRETTRYSEQRMATARIPDKITNTDSTKI